MSKKVKQQGFIALISAIIISAVLMSMAAAGNLAGFYARSQVLDAELKARNAEVASGCAKRAILEIIQNTSYAGTQTKTANLLDRCTYAVSSGAVASEKSIDVYATSSRQAITRLHIVFDTTSLKPLSWLEVSR